MYRLCQRAAPYATLWECLEIKASDDAKIIAAALKGTPEVCPGSGVGIDDGAGCENELHFLAQHHFWVRFSQKEPTSKFTTLSHAHPSRGAKYEMPPTRRHVNIR